MSDLSDKSDVSDQSDMTTSRGCAVRAMRLFTTSNECHRIGLRAGAIAFRNVEVSPSADAIGQAMDEEVARIRSEFGSAADIRSLEVVRRFREIHRHVQADPRKHPPSVEALMQFAFRRNCLPKINCLVDAYNLVSVRSGFSMGAHDLDSLTLPVELRILQGTETFTPLESQTSKTIRAGEFAYVDADQQVICWLDVLQAEFSKVSYETTSVLLIVEGNDVHDQNDYETAVAQSIEWITAHCGGIAEVVAEPIW